MVKKAKLNLKNKKASKKIDYPFGGLSSAPSGKTLS
jgi:hypothetical protein